LAGLHSYLEFKKKEMENEVLDESLVEQMLGDKGPAQPETAIQRQDGGSANQSALQLQHRPSEPKIDVN